MWIMYVGIDLNYQTRKLYTYVYMRIMGSP